MNVSSQSPERDPRVDDIIAGYLDDEKHGRACDRTALLAQYPEFAAELKAFFSDHLTLRLTNSSSQSSLAEELPTVEPPLSLVPGMSVRYFGDYEIIEEIARGGMGVVYKSRQISLKRVVALKMILAGRLASPQDVERFRREAEAAANLDHPHIVPIYEIGDLQGQHYFSMKLFEGGSLAHALAHGLWPRDKKDRGRSAAGLMAIVARAVHHAHQRGILHRDLKPGNIILDENGTPFVTDFGLAMRVENESRHTGTGSILGTPGYMSPEQARSEKVLTTAADVYSLGAILYELLCGKPPFHAATALETLLLVIEQDPTPPRRLSPNVDADLETICMKCLEKDQGRRYDSAADLAVDLERWLRGETIRARPATIVERTWKWMQRKPLQASLILLVLASAISIAGVVLITDRQVREQQQVANAATKARDAAADLARTIRYMQGVAVVGRTLESGADVYSAEKRLLNLPPELRGWEWHLLKMRTRADMRFLIDSPGQQLSDVTALMGVPDLAAFRADQPWGSTEPGELTLWDSNRGTMIRSHSGVFRPISISPTINVFASMSSWRNDSVVVRDLDSGHVKGTMVLSKDEVRSLSFSPNGKLLAAGVATEGMGGAIVMWDTTTYKTLVRCEQHRTPVEHVVFSPDGHRFVAASPSDEELILWDTSTGNELRRFAGAGKIVSVAFSPRGDLMASSDDSRITIWDVNTGMQIRVIERGVGQPMEDIFDTSWGRDSANAITFSADGKFLAAGGDTATERGTNEYAAIYLGTLRVWDVDTGQQVLLLRGKIGAIRQLSFSPDGRRLVWSGRENGLSICDFSRMRSTSNLTGHGPVAVGPDGRLVAWCDGRVHVYDTRSGQLVGPPMGSVVVGPSGVAFSHDGKRIAGGFNSGTWNTPIWDVSTGSQVALLKGNAPPVGIRFSPNDSLVLLAEGQRACVYDVPSGNEVFSPSPFNSKVYCGAFSPDGKLLATGGLKNSGESRGEVIVWDLSTRQAVRVLDGLFDGTTSLAWSPDGKHIAGCAGEPLGDSSTRRQGNLNEILVWEAATGELRLRLEGHSADVNAVLFTPDGRLVSASADRTVKIWDIQVGLEILNLREANGPIVSLAMSEDGSVLAAGGVQYPSGPGAKVQSRLNLWFAHPFATAPEGHRYPFLEFSGEFDVGQILAGVERPTVQFQSAVTSDQEWFVGAVPDLSAFLVPTRDRRVSLYDVGAGSIRYELVGMNEAVSAIGVNETGTIAAAANGPVLKTQLQYDAQSGGYIRNVSGKDGPGEVVVWDLATGHVRNTFHDHTQPVNSVAISPDGATVASASAKENLLYFWDSTTGQKHNTIEGRFAMIVFSPDGEMLLARRYPLPEDDSSMETVIIDIETAKVVLAVSDPDGRFRYHQFSPDARRFIRFGRKEAYSTSAAIEPSQAQIIDAQTGNVELVFEEPKGVIRAVAWGPGPDRLTTASDNHYVRVWDIASSRIIRSHNYGHSGLQQVWLSSDGSKLARLSHDGSGEVQVWDVARLPVIGP